MKNAKQILSLASKHHRDGNYREAIALYRKVLSFAPDNPDILHMLGIISIQTGKNEDAVRFIRKAIEHKNTAAYVTNLAAALQNLGKNEEAITACRQAILLSQNNFRAYNTLGNALRESGKFSEAIGSFQHAILLKNDVAEIHFNLGNVLKETGDLTGAVSSLLKAVEINPGYAEAYNCLGNVLYLQEKPEAAEECYRSALRTKPDYIETHYNLANILNKLKKHDEAVQHYQAAISLKPDFADAYYNLGNAFNSLERRQEAVVNYQRAIELKPDFAEAYNGAGNAFREMGNGGKALEYYHNALQLKPGFAEVYYNIGNVLLDQGDAPEALASCRKAIALKPDLAEAHWNSALALLTLGHFEDGWRKYEWRFLKNDAHLPPFQYPEWDGAYLEGKALLVCAEQGVGDEIMFASCLPDVISRADRCVVECDKRLIPLFSRSFPDVEYFERSNSAGSPTLVAKAEKGSVSGDNYPIDFQISLGSLPKYFRNDFRSFSGLKAYLKPDPGTLKIWEERLRSLGEGLKIGISWRGGKDAYVRNVRSTSLEQWAEIFSLQGLHFINLQYGDCAAELLDVKERFGTTIHDWEDADPIKDLDNFAAEIAALDLVISVDNSTVHMAGALGIPVWTLLPFGCDWRWMRDFEDTPWYPSMRLFRQPDYGNWQKVFEHVVFHLKQYVTTKVVPAIEQEHSYENHGALIKSLHPIIRSAHEKTYRCAVLTPVGPGHAHLYDECLASVQKAFSEGKGRFCEAVPIKIEDFEGALGRSKARNKAIHLAAEQGAEWIFFLDADDIMAPLAFEYVSPYLDAYDAIWGSIWSIEKGEKEAKKRPGQLPFLYSIEDVLSCDPFVTLQMGHFVKTSVALATLFNESLDTGEDFDYYLRIWQKYKCIKTPLPLFYNRRGDHSQGQKSATGKEWNQEVGEIIMRCRHKVMGESRE